MPVHVCLFRGVNVGQCRVKMAELKRVFEELGYTNVQPYLQSGNLIFASEKSDAHALRIQKAVKTAFGFDIPTLVISVDQLAKIAKGNPFLKGEKKEESFLHFTFTFEDAKGKWPEFLPKTGEEEAVSVSTGVYLYCPHGYGRTKLSNTYFERVLKVPATTRNWRTVQALLAIARAESHG